MAQEIANLGKPSMRFGIYGGLSDLVIIGTDFPEGLSKYIVVGTGGDIVYENDAGVTQFISGAATGAVLPLVASKIVKGPITVRGISRSTTASNMSWIGGY
jgi:hypothetical protein